MTSSINTFGETLRTARRDAGLTQQDVARAIGCSKSSVSAWELDDPTRPPSPELVVRLEELFGVAFDTTGNDDVIDAIAVLRRMAKDPKFREWCFGELGITHGQVARLQEVEF